MYKVRVEKHGYPKAAPNEILVVSEEDFNRYGSRGTGVLAFIAKVDGEEEVEEEDPITLEEIGVEVESEPFGDSGEEEVEDVEDEVQPWKRSSIAFGRTS